MAKKITIHCAFDKLVDTDSLVPNPQNPNVHSEKQVAKLAVLIRYHGWRHPITVSKRSGFIISGHCRLAAAQALALKKVPVDYQKFANEAEEWAVLVSDNIIQDFSEFDGQIMADGLVMLDQLNMEVGNVTGLDKEQIEDFILGPGVSPEERPEFDDLIKGFDEGQIGGSDKDANWLYVEFYNDNRRFKRIKALLGDMIVGEHELNKEAFYEFVTSHATEKKPAKSSGKTKKKKSSARSKRRCR